MEQRRGTTERWIRRKKEKMMSSLFSRDSFCINQKEWVRTNNACVNQEPRSIDHRLLWTCENRGESVVFEKPLTRMSLERRRLRACSDMRHDWVSMPCHSLQHSLFPDASRCRQKEELSCAEFKIRWNKQKCESLRAASNKEKSAHARSFLFDYRWDTSIFHDFECVTTNRRVTWFTWTFVDYFESTLTRLEDTKIMMTHSASMNSPKNKARRSLPWSSSCRQRVEKRWYYHAFSLDTVTRIWLMFPSGWVRRTIVPVVIYFQCIQSWHVNMTMCQRTTISSPSVLFCSIVNECPWNSSVRKAREERWLMQWLST